MKLTASQKICEGNVDGSNCGMAWPPFVNASDQDDARRTWTKGSGEQNDEGDHEREQRGRFREREAQECRSAQAIFHGRVAGNRVHVLGPYLADADTTA